MDGGAQLISILTKTAEAADPDAAPVYYAAVVWQNGTVVEAGSFSPTNPGYKILASTQALCLLSRVLVCLPGFCYCLL